LSVVSVVCCQVEVSATKITRPEESYRLWCVVVCDLETSRMRRLRPALGSNALKIVHYLNRLYDLSAFTQIPLNRCIKLNIAFLVRGEKKLKGRS
jgi:hypothetical protein